MRCSRSLDSMAKPTLLIVEDHPTHQYVFKQLCEQFNYEMVIVGSGEDALGALAVAQYAAVLLDINLPGANGLDIVRSLRHLEKERTLKHTPVIAITANADPECKIECLEAGADDYLSKPFSIDDFRKILLRWTYDARKPNLKLINTASNEKQLFG